MLAYVLLAENFFSYLSTGYIRNYKTPFKYY